MTVRFGNIFKGDRIIWGLIVVFLVYSLLAVYSSSVSVAFASHGGNTGYFLKWQILMIFASLIIILIVHHLPTKVFFQLAGFFVLVSIVLLILTLIIGVRVNEAARSLIIPGTDFRIQTSDVAKVSLVIYLARMLSRQLHDLNDFKLTTRVFIVPIGIICALILPQNLSTALLIFGICMIILFIGRVPLKFIFAWIGIGLAAVILFAIILDATTDTNRVSTWKARIENFVSGEDDGDGDYQANQAKIAIATGGLIGKAPGNSVQRNMLPQSNSDFIFAIIIEEYGLLFGALPLLFLYLILLFRGIAIARKCETAFPAFLVLGLTIMIVVQAIVNMAVAVGLIPVTGQTLPMISWGRISMGITSISLGAILGVSRVVNAKARQEIIEEEDEVAEQDEVIYEGATT
ncbi:MAG: FtsW/RodA/SpoVE family cell cycle protein [Bacteroidales bacterium]|nr:FtsW/RodA/SpoVE family cell cycle protein [Bacteroidales bacterium]